MKHLQKRTAIRDSIVVSISACHADDPGSIPGRGVYYISTARSQLSYGTSCIDISVVGLVVRISAFQADGPGSIPGQRTFFNLLFSLVTASRSS